MDYIEELFDVVLVDKIEEVYIGCCAAGLKLTYGDISKEYSLQGNNPKTVISRIAIDWTTRLLNKE